MNSTSLSTTNAYKVVRDFQMAVCKGLPVGAIINVNFDRWEGGVGGALQALARMGCRCRR